MADDPQDATKSDLSAPVRVDLMLRKRMHPVATGAGTAAGGEPIGLLLALTKAS